MNKLVILYLILFWTAVFPQSIENQKKELDSLRGGIKEIEELLKQNKEEEKQTVKTIDLYTRQNYLLNSLLKEISSTLAVKNKNIENLSMEVNRINLQADSLKAGYSAYVISVYKGIHDNIWVYLLSSESFTEAAYRYYMMRRITKSGKRTLAKLDSTKVLLQSVKNQLLAEKEEEEELLTLKSNEELVLKTRLKERKELLNEIRKNNAELRRDLVSKKKNEQKIKSLIDNLIANELRKKKEREEELARLKKKKEEERKKSDTKIVTPESKVKPKKEPEMEDFADLYNLPGNTEFNLLKGKLIWPVKSGAVYRKFGENKNEKLNTVTLNYGIDIKSKPESEVLLVHDGVVSVIDWLPGYGSVVIVTHSKDFRTVYGHLSSINVKEGDRLKKGTILGRVGESLEGYILHFQIWNDRTNQNPEIWLAKK